MPASRDAEDLEFDRARAAGGEHIGDRGVDIGDIGRVHELPQDIADDFGRRQAERGLDGGSDVRDDA